MHANYLDKIVERKKKELQLLIRETEENPHHSLNEVLKHNRACTGRFAKALRGPDLAVISEIKRRSPSKGEMNEIKDPVELAKAYCQGGASAISVLTDEVGFGGSLEDLKYVSQFTQAPTLRKDFIVHPLQLAEAVAAGASAVLLIVRVLGNDLKFFLEESHRLGLETLTEVHDREDLELALANGAPIIGINHRNLATFAIDLNISNELRPLIPSSVITVAESGIHDPAQARRMRELGYDAILVGEALVRSQDPKAMIRQFKRGCHES